MSEKVEKKTTTSNEVGSEVKTKYVSLVKQDNQVQISNFIINTIKDFFNEEKGNKLTKYNTNGIMSFLFDQTQQKLNSMGVVNIGLNEEKEVFTKDDIVDIQIKPEQKPNEQ